MGVTKRTRYEVMRRDDYTCRYCRSTVAALTIDHVIPQALGGDDSPGNLVACCVDCNSGKSSSMPDAALVTDVEADTFRWAAARKLAAQKIAIHADRWRRERCSFAASWGRWDEDGDHLPADWAASLDSWLDQGLEIAQILESHNIAINNRHVQSDNVFRYVAGIARNKLVDLDEATRAILNG